MSGPLTEAGRRLVKWEREGNVPWDVALETVLAIEIEAADAFAKERDAARAAAPPVDQIAETIIEGTIGLSPEPTPGLRTPYSLDIQRRVESLFDHADARDHDELHVNGSRSSWRCIPIAEVIDAIEAADLAASPAPEPTGLDAAQRAERFLLEGAVVLEAIRDLHREAGRMSRVSPADVAIVVAVAHNLTTDALRARLPESGS